MTLRISNIGDEIGDVCKSVGLEQEQCRRQFLNILNVKSVFEVDEFAKLWQRPVREELANPPSKQEIQEAIGKMKNGKAGAELGILPEMLKIICGENKALEMLPALFYQVWKQCRDSSFWYNAVLIPISRKGNLKCDNWRGIALLYVVGKWQHEYIKRNWQKINFLSHNVAL